MKTKFFSSIRWQMIRYFLLSVILAVAAVALSLLFLLFLDSVFFPIGRFFGPLAGHPISYLVMLLAGALFFIFGYLLMTRKMIRDFERISRSLETIAGGNLDHRLPTLGRDELGELAENINRMTDRLQRSINDERSARRARDELITNVSHDLRTPLTSILGYLDLIESDRYRDEVELRHYTQIVYAKAQRLRQMIEDLFEYTRLHGGNIRLEMQTINLGDLLSQLATEMLPVMEDAGMQCRTSPPEEKVLIRADGDKLVRVFENLLANASLYGKEGRYADLAWLREGNEAVVRVTNYGPPIPSYDLPYIFERFYRVEKSRSENAGGTGLGLAIARNIVELHHGRIAAFSDPQRTCFEVRLPLHAVSPKEARWKGPAV